MPNHVIVTDFGSYPAPKRVDKLLDYTKWNNKHEPDGRYYLTKLYSEWYETEIKRLKKLCRAGHDQPAALNDIDALTFGAAIVFHEVQETKRINAGQRR